MKRPQMFRRRQNKKKSKQVSPIGVAVSPHSEEIDPNLFPANVSSHNGKKYLKLAWRVVGISIIVIIILSLFGYINVIRSFVTSFGAGKGGLIVSSEYVQTNIFLDGKLLGQTPFTGESIDVGRHELTLKAVENINDYFVDQVLDIEISSGNTTIVKSNVAPSNDLISYVIITSKNKKWNEKTLAIKGVPVNAEVTIDGAPMGIVPMETSAILAGAHQITLSSEGYKPSIVDVQLLPEKMVEIEFKLYKYQIKLENQE